MIICIYKHKHTIGPNALYTMCYFSNTRSHTRAQAHTSGYCRCRNT